MSEFASTQSEILARLRRGPRTVAELTTALGLTRNAVLVPLTELEARGLVRRSQLQRTGRVGKPAHRFEIVPERVEQISPAYKALAPHLLAVIAAALPAEIAEAMDRIGQSIHGELAATLGAKDHDGLDEAVRFLSEQGADIELVNEGGDLILLSHSCPIGQLVRTDRCICRAMAAFLAEATATETISEC